jgi:hypothetical protein
MADWLSMYSTEGVVMGNPSSCSILHIQMISLPASQAAMYSASVVDSVTMDWRFNIQETTQVSINLHNVGTSGVTSAPATSMVGIRVGGEELGH